MAPTLKDSDTLTAPEITARSGSAGSASTESAVKAQPVALEIPITVNGARTVEGSEKREPFSESTKTVMVFGSGAVIRLTSAMAPGQLLFLTNERTKKEVVCQVVKSKNYRNVSGYVELEFTEPAVGFWGMRFPGDRIGPGPQAAQSAAPVPVRPAVSKVEPPAASSAPSVIAAKPTTPAPAPSKPASPVTASSSIAPPAIDTKAKPEAKVPPAPIATSLEADTPLVEPWLKKREPAPRVPAAPPSVVPPSTPAKPAEAEASLTPVRSFAVQRPSDKPASLFAPVEAPANLASVDLSGIAPFFEVKPAVADMPAAPTKAPAANDSGTEELKQQTARLQDELGKMQFVEAESSSTAKAEAEKHEAKRPEAKRPEPEMEISDFPLTEQSIATLKTELVHENAVRLVESPEPTNEVPVLAEVSKLEEPLSVEPPAVIPSPSATIPALESLEQEEMKIPAWLAPLARNSSAPASTQELVLREKTKRHVEQPHLQELVSPLVAAKEERVATESRVPQFGSALPFEEAKSARESSQKKSGNGMLLGIAAGILALAGGGWWYMKQKPAGSEVASVQAPPVSAASQDLQTSAIKESVLGTTSAGQNDRTVSDAKAASSNATSSPVSNVSIPAPTSSLASSASGPHANANGPNVGSMGTKGDSAPPEPVQAVEKKPVLGEVHLATPKISQKRTLQAGAAPDAVLSEEPPDNTDSLGGLAVASNQPAAPTVPVAVGGDVKQAKLLSSVPPVYPAMAKTQHVSGAVTIDALIDVNGRVTTMKVISGPALLQEAAKDALKQWKYEPAMLDGKAVPMHLNVTLQFRLQQ